MHAAVARAEGAPALYMTPAGRAIWVRDEGRADPVLPNGKLRGVVPYLHALRAAGVVGVVNAGASHSNSHAITARAAALAGLPAATVANVAHLTPQLLLAQRLGAEVILTRPLHLGPLLARARAVAAARGWYPLPWGFAAPEVVDGTATTVAEVPDDWDAYVVAVGSGGYAAALAIGAARYGRRARVVGVAAMPQANTEARVRALALPDCQDRLAVVALPAGCKATPTPFASDPRYEWPAWTIACQLADAGERVLFWSVGTPCE